MREEVSLVAVFWMSRNVPPKETERCVTSKKRLRERLYIRDGDVSGLVSVLVVPFTGVVDLKGAVLIVRLVSQSRNRNLL